jgi:hypothetical protein
MAQAKYRGIPIGGVNHWHDVAIPLLGRGDIVPGASGREALNRRVKLLPLDWAGMPKTSCRKSSDSPKNTIKSNI